MQSDVCVFCTAVKYAFLECLLECLDMVYVAP